MTIEVRTIRDDELATFVDTLSTGFLDRPKDVAKIAEELRPDWDLGRVWAAFDGDRLCGTFRSWATEMTVPGGRRLPASALAAVTVLPTHRRRGILRAMTAAEHAAIRHRGEAFALLHAAEWPIYGRFGYGPATQEATWTLDTRAASFVGEPVGRVVLARPDAATRDLARAVFETWRLRETAGIRRRDVLWDIDFALIASSWGEDWKGFVALHEDPAGAVDGYVRYSRKDDHWEGHQPRNVLRVDELVAVTETAYADLWRYLSGIDWVGTVQAERRAPGERLPWLLANARAATVSDIGDDLWVRIFDVPLALGTRSYERSGRVVLDVVDAELPDGRIRVGLDVGPDGADSAVTTASPDLTIDIAALGAAYLGGTRLRDAVIVSGWDEHRPGALIDADRLLRTIDEPWCTTFF